MVYDAEITFHTRVDIIRTGVHLVAGRAPQDLPKNWRMPQFLAPPSPASEYGHCRDSINRHNVGQPDTPEYQWRLFHDQFPQHIVGVESSIKTRSNGAKKEVIRATDWAMQAFAGTPCVTIMLARANVLLGRVVRPNTGRPACTCHLHGE